MSIQLRDILRPNELTANAVTNAISKGQRILVVGTKGDNLPQWTQDHPQIVQWASTSNEVARADALPTNVGVVLFLKWISHIQHKRLRAFANESKVYAHPELLNTGEARRLLKPLQPSTLETPVPTWDGSLFSFVEQHYDYGTERGHQRTEGERLLPLAHAHGIDTTLGSMTGTISVVHRSIERAREAEQQARYPPVVQMAPAVIAPPLGHAHGAGTPLTPPHETPSVAALVTASATSDAQVDTTLTELLRMLDDAVAVLGLAREQLVSLSAKNAALRTSREALREKVLGIFDGI